MSKKITERAVKIIKEDSINFEDIQSVADGTVLEPDQTYRNLIFGLVHKNFEDSEAKALWVKLMKHYDQLTILLQRDVGIQVAAYDFFSNIMTILEEPVIIESNEIEEITKLAVNDSLTGLHTRRVYLVFLKKFEENYNRNTDVFSIILLDIDDFKIVNDTYGHLEGDYVLKRFGHVIKENIRESDIAFRYGGDEFAILLPKTSSDQSKVLAEKLRISLNNAFSDKEYNITASFGIDEVRHSYDHKEIAYNADRALYVSKEEGKNNITLYSEI